MRERRCIAVEGTVQGVGFRPFVYRLAVEHRLGGSVRNVRSGVVIEVEGEPGAVGSFCDRLGKAGPPLARVERITLEPVAAVGERDFYIDESRMGEQRSAPIPPDAATCGACLAELFDPQDRRHGYPFINCTDCGPRLSILKDLPYDRVRTTMAGFRMCNACRREYEDPTNRRYHAEAIACPDCGPQVRLRDRSGKVLAVADPLATAAAALASGGIVGVKGLGGFHLACDALSEKAVERLRRLKHRPAKPLAVIVRDRAAAERLCFVDAAEGKLLESPSSPIVLLERRSDCPVAEHVAPGQRCLGVMLAYTPLHHLLLTRLETPLVMTSGNVSDEPIAYRDEDALARLSGIADLFLTHERPIAMRSDDSVTRSAAGRTVFIRRSRGYVPEPISVPMTFETPVLALGGDLKNAFALARGREVFVSQHIGDLQDLGTYAELREAIADYRRLLGIEPAMVAHDLHPGYLSTRLATELGELEPVAVQHHHAHLAACLTENRVAEPVIGVILDGTGYGPDGAIWGGEFLVGNCEAVERVAHLGYVPLPGGDAAIREPWRAAACHLIAADAAELAAGFIGRIGERRWNAVAAMTRSREASVPTSSMGRLFDAVAALMGLCETAQFEGQAAMLLEAAADRGELSSYPVDVTEGAECLIWRPEPIIRSVAADVHEGQRTSQIAARFHNTLCAAIKTVCTELRRRRGLRRVGLSGGVFQNALLLERAASALEASGFEVLLHRRLPPNDGGLCLGQAMVAGAQSGFARR